MILVKCRSSEDGVEDGTPCKFLVARRVVPIVNDSGLAELEEVEWGKPKVDDLAGFPRRGTKVALVLYPDGTAPSLAVEDCRVYKVWAGPVVFIFIIRDMEFDTSPFFGNVFSVVEV